MGVFFNALIIFGDEQTSLSIKHDLQIIDRAGG
jgi:hypothetical protein